MMEKYFILAIIQKLAEIHNPVSLYQFRESLEFKSGYAYYIGIS